MTLDSRPSTVLVTGGAGFIGSHLCESLLKDGEQVICLDNFDDFYDPGIKERNIARASEDPNFTLIRGDIRDAELLNEIFSSNQRPRTNGQEPITVVHIAAKAGVRPSIEDPRGYYETNVGGTQNLLETARKWGVKQFVFASSSSVYGENPNVPWREDDYVLKPISPYASTKVSCELLGHVYSHLYGMRFIALRFFTVYGPRQRPDLAINKFARLMLAGEEVPIYGDGSSRRDYTYIADIIQGIRAAIDYEESDYEIINLGAGRTISLLDMVQSLEKALGVKAKLKMLPFQSGDVPQTWASIEKARDLLGYQPTTTFEKGVKEFAKWVGAFKKKEK